MKNKSHSRSQRSKSRQAARQERSAGFIIFRLKSTGEREYLLLDYGRHWDFAKGHLEAGEDDITAARRELLEETGLRDPLVISNFHHEITYFFRGRDSGLIRKSVAFFLGQTDATDADVRVSHEHRGFIFLPFEQAVKRTTYPTARQVLHMAEQRMVEQDTLSPSAPSS
jgi:bis(5'-nucleosidyl)-tetraphosphatase